jgi:hypothetical protein
MQDALTTAIRAEFLLKCPKNLRLNGLELKCRLIADATATLDAIAAFASEPGGEQPPLLRQWLRTAGSNFSECETGSSPGEQMPVAGDGNCRLIVGSLHGSLSVDLEELRMETSSVQLEDQLIYLRTNA